MTQELSQKQSRQLNKYYAHKDNMDKINNKTPQNKSPEQSAGNWFTWPWSRK